MGKPIEETITKIFGTEIKEKFKSIVDKRNRIIHSFQCTIENEQMLCTKDQNNKQYRIDNDYLMKFIKENEELSGLLHNCRGF